MHPRVSIVMPCHNGAVHLSRSIGSVIAQTMADWELLLVDDGSTDDSLAIAQAHARTDPRIRPIGQPRAGAVAARNRAISSASGTHLCFLDADDTWHPEFLEAMLQALATNPDCAIAYCGWQNLGLGGGRDIPYVPPDYELKGKVEAFVRSCPWPIHAVVLRRDMLEETLRFDESLITSEDYELWLRLGLGRRVLRVPRVLAYYHHHTAVARLTDDKGRVALNHLRVQQRFLQEHPDVVALLGRQRVRELTLGPLLKRGLEAYWRRDLGAARTIFREVMRHGYGRPKAWIYMLPSWLPEAWHRILLSRVDGARTA